MLWIMSPSLKNMFNITLTFNFDCLVFFGNFGDFYCLFWSLVSSSYSKIHVSSSVKSYMKQVWVILKMLDVFFHVQLIWDHLISQSMIATYYLPYLLNINHRLACWKLPTPGVIFTFSKTCDMVLSQYTCWSISSVCVWVFPNQTKNFRLICCLVFIICLFLSAHHWRTWKRKCVNKSMRKNAES